MVLNSASTPLIHSEVGARWFRLPNFVLLLPVPALTAWLWIILMRRIGRREEAKPFLCSLGLFALGCLGLAISLWPYIVAVDLDRRPRRCALGRDPSRACPEPAFCGRRRQRLQRWMQCTRPAPSAGREN
jgi:hypothetical protein